MTDILNSKTPDRSNEIYQNEQSGVTCYVNEENSSEWSLWRDSNEVERVEECMLVDWITLGPDGMIWVLWEEASEMVVALEYADYTLSVPVVKQGLMHLPSKQTTGLVFSAEPGWNIEKISLGNAGVYFLSYPLMTDHEAQGYALYSATLEMILPPIINRPHCEGHGLLGFSCWQGDQAVCAVFNCTTRQYVVPPDYENIFHVGHRWFCNFSSNRCDMRDEQGELIQSLPYRVISSGLPERLFVECNGLWGWADHQGGLLENPWAKDSEELLAAPIKIDLLSITETTNQKLVLISRQITKINQEIEELGGFSMKYEAVECVPGEGEGGYLDIAKALVSFNVQSLRVRALSITNRFTAHSWLVLLERNQNLEPGVILELGSNGAAKTISQESYAAQFLDSVLSMLYDD